MKIIPGYIFVFVIAFHNCAARLRRCCDENVSVQDYHWTCTNGKPIDLDCPKEGEYIKTLNNEWSIQSAYLEGSDSRGTFLDAFGLGLVFREPYYCEVSVLHTGSDATTEAIAFICIKKADSKADSDAIDYDTVSEAPIPFSEELIYFIIYDANCVSAIALALTAIIYWSLKKLQDVYGTCILHLSICLCLFHAYEFYETSIEDYSFLYHFCITQMYFRLYIMLSTLCWNCVIGYDSWIQLKTPCSQLDNDILIKRYQYFSYGIPLGPVILANIYAHGKKLYTEFKFELDCFAHQQFGAFIFIVVPMALLVIATSLIWFNTQRLLWKLQTEETRRSFAKRIKYRLMINCRLIFTAGVPWSLYLTLSVLYSFFDSEVVGILINLMFCWLSLEGVFIFLILVVLRKRVLREIFGEWLPNHNIIPQKWREFANDDAESEVEIVQSDGTQTAMPTARTENDELDRTKSNDSIIALE